MHDAPQPSILSFTDARRTVEQHSAFVRPGETESVDLLSGIGRVLAEPIYADRDFPPFPRSTRDGYAVRSEDLAKVPTQLDLIGEIKAGDKSTSIPAQIQSGQTVGIMTGAPVPNGADAVVMVEYCKEQGDRVQVLRTVDPRDNIVSRGAEARQGTVLVDVGRCLNDAATGLAASVGKSQLLVFRRPRVAILSTGDEVVDIDRTPGPTEIRNSNSYSLAVQIQQAGGDPLRLPIAPDEPNHLRRLIEQGLQADLLLMTGGVSMGRYDLVEQVLSELKAEFFFTGAQIQPGRPIVFGRCGAPKPASEPQFSYFFGLPGNPVSTMVTFELFARPMVESLAGMIPRKLFYVQAILKQEIKIKPGLTRFLPAILSGEFENSRVELVPWQGSGDIAATARANCYLVIPPNRDRILEGELVSIILR